MSNKRVYLAKTPLASGSDVEYVKSNLLRIPEIELIEYGSRVSPEECSSFVLVPGDDFDIDNGCFVLGDNNVAHAIESFLSENDLSCIYLYSGQQDTNRHSDVENTTPMYVSIVDYDIIDEDCDNYLQLDFYEDEEEVLSAVSSDIECYNSKQWRAVARRYVPESIYAAPKVEPKGRKVSTSVEQTSAGILARRPLLGRRRKR